MVIGVFMGEDDVGHRVWLAVWFEERAEMWEIFGSAFARVDNNVRRRASDKIRVCSLWQNREYSVARGKVEVGG